MRYFIAIFPKIKGEHKSMQSDFWSRNVTETLSQMYDTGPVNPRYIKMYGEPGQYGYALVKDMMLSRELIRL